MNSKIDNFKSMKIKSSLSNFEGGKRETTYCDNIEKNACDVRVIRLGRFIKNLTNKFDGNPFNNDVHRPLLNMKILLSLYFTLSAFFSIYAQDEYIEYYTNINKAKEYIVELELNNALNTYVKILTKYDYPFYRHINQAAIIAYYAKDNCRLKKLLEICIKRGMNKEYVSFFTKNNEYLHCIETKYDSLHNLYLSSIDTALMFNFVELDVIDRYANKLPYTKDTALHKKHKIIHKQMAKRYIKIIDSLGFPTEKKVGLAKILYDSPNKNTINTKDYIGTYLYRHKDIYPENPYLFVNIQEEKGIRPEGFKPGNRFLWHYYSILHEKDFFAKRLEKEFKKLNLSRITLVSYYEKARDINYDFCITMFSIFAFKQYLSDKEKIIINNNRKKLFFQSIEFDNKLMKTLYHLKYQKYPKQINKKIKKRIGYEYNSFFFYG